MENGLFSTIWWDIRLFCKKNETICSCQQYIMLLDRVSTCMSKWKYFHQSFTMPWLWKFLEFNLSPKGIYQPASTLLNLFAKQIFRALQLIDIHIEWVWCQKLKTCALAQRTWFKQPILYIAATMQWNVEKSKVPIFFQVSLTLVGGCSFANLNRER